MGKIHIPTLWYRNTWAWGCKNEGKPSLKLIGNNVVLGEHESLGVSYQYACTDEAGNTPELIWTENETNSEKIFGQPLDTPYVKDAFHSEYE